MEPLNFTVTDTNLAALKAKKSAVDLGYMKDAFIHFFVPSTPRKEVLLNKGYWLRSHVISKLVQSFVAHSKEEVQVLSLGCGLDTAPFNLLSSLEGSGTKLKYFESDLESVVAEKVGVISHHAPFKQFVEGHLHSQLLPQGVDGDKYALFPLDLNRPDLLAPTLAAHRVDPQCPHQQTDLRPERVRAGLPAGGLRQQSPGGGGPVLRQRGLGRLRDVQLARPLRQSDGPQLRGGFIRIRASRCTPFRSSSPSSRSTRGTAKPASTAAESRRSNDCSTSS